MRTLRSEFWGGPLPRAPENPAPLPAQPWQALSHSSNVMSPDFCLPQRCEEVRAWVWEEVQSSREEASHLGGGVVSGEEPEGGLRLGSASFLGDPEWACCNGDRRGRA